MKKIIFVLCVFTFLFNCNNTDKEEKKETAKAKVVYDMYESSEMTLLMRDMYKTNKVIKKAIVNQKPIGDFPDSFLQINTATLSKFKARDEGFKNFTKAFLDAEREIFNANSEVDIETRFNNAINLCVSCHQTECSGPIPKIKKLLIK